MITDGLTIIKERWNESNRYRMVAMQNFQIFEKAQLDVIYLSTRLEEAHKTISNLIPKIRTHCSYPNHERIQISDRQACPECGDDSFIPKVGSTCT